MSLDPKNLKIDIFSNGANDPNVTMEITYLPLGLKVHNHGSNHQRLKNDLLDRLEILVYEAQREFKIITDAKELAGKTIIKVVYGWDRITLGFSDKTYCVIESKSGYDGETTLEFENIRGTYDSDEKYYLRDLGWIDKEEFEKRNKAASTAWKKKNELEERRSLKALQAKYKDYPPYPEVM